MMSSPAAHLGDETLSNLLDGQLPLPEAQAARSHVGACTNCASRLDELRVVTQLLRAIPEVEPPRDFTIGPRLVGEPAVRYQRLQRWYTWSRTAASAMAALFVLVLGANIYVEAVRQGAPEERLAALRAPEPAAALPAAPTPAPRAARPQAAPAASPAAPVATPPGAETKVPAVGGQQPAIPAAPAGAEATSPATPVAEQAPERAGDQRKTTTEARDLESRKGPLEVAWQPANVLRLALVAAGSLAAACVLAALLLRHRLHHVQARVAEIEVRPRRAGDRDTE
jgi:hypothetical protein